ncbi:probable LRR receptor-like serine/threonine-protein kinase At1g51860 [Ziziphus jujuba]|uniref:Probable LRR receptor-like serine/threonine-protein kinase At1g51860 n=1 Tax=Ziziphus jujuba TaxID=326968 RepID=A0ABM4A114_ZIZJJ|nr:probable LRR receptor-like serine/threonine-protein kinase At1g51860 [Ziziphus jujuba]
MTKSIGEAISTHLGDCIMIDSDEEGLCLGKFMRVRVKLDVRRPLRRGMRLALNDHELEDDGCGEQYGAWLHANHSLNLSLGGKSVRCKQINKTRSFDEVSSQSLVPSLSRHHYSLITAPSLVTESAMHGKQLETTVDTEWFPKHSSYEGKKQQLLHHDSFDDVAKLSKTTWLPTDMVVLPPDLYIAGPKHMEVVLHQQPHEDSMSDLLAGPSQSSKGYWKVFPTLRKREFPKSRDKFAEDWTNISSSSSVASDENTFRLPSPIISTAATPKSINGSLEYQLYDNVNGYYVYLHFAELESLLPNQSRQFTVSYGGEVLDTISPKYLQANTVRTYNALSGAKSFNISRTPNSTHPSIINAIEIYVLKQFLQSDTLQTDDIHGNHSIRNLSSSGLTGEIPLAISSLTMLEVLDLSDNNFAGSVPEFLSKSPNLKILNLEKNNLNGSRFSKTKVCFFVPYITLIVFYASHRESSTITWYLSSVDQNPDLRVSVSCKRKKKNIVVPVVASIAGTITFLLIVAAVCWGIKRKLKHVDVTDERSTTLYTSLESKERQFTWSDIVRITSNFERILGKGGFGSVFHGLIDGTEVAVKVLSHSSVQGYEQFHTEANLLMRIHHRNLMSLVGYCNDGTNAALIYEYMANGNLETHLSDDSSSILKWEDRIRIVLEVAQGLEYLHAGCKPPIVHRDVKPTNILLNESFQAKLFDLGISKLFLTDGKTHELTLVAGTPRYLDPEYQMTNRLKDKSDVYSYGVVLLEIISGQPAVPKTDEGTHISTWVNSMLAKGDIKSIVDRRLDGNFDINSVWKSVEIAMACVPLSSTNRPTMSQVVMELRECLAAEQNFVGMTHETGFDDFIELASLNTYVSQRPLTR